MFQANCNQKYPLLMKGKGKISYISQNLGTNLTMKLFEYLVWQCHTIKYAFALGATSFLIERKEFDMNPWNYFI